MTSLWLARQGCSDSDGASRQRARQWLQCYAPALKTYVKHLQRCRRFLCQCFCYQTLHWYACQAGMRRQESWRNQADLESILIASIISEACWPTLQQIMKSMNNQMCVVSVRRQKVLIGCRVRAVACSQQLGFQQICSRTCQHL